MAEAGYWAREGKASRLGVIAVDLYRVNEFTPSVRPTAHMHELRAADAIVGLIPISL